MLDLTLTRISKLLANSNFPWRAVHVAGTNGKGSVCSYLSSMLKASGVRYAQFTSPHLIDRWDCIALDGNPISESLFRDIERGVIRKNENEKIQATEFELLTATAFEAFSRHKAEVGVVEVGLGGRLDATNVLQSPFACVITKIGLDHQALLGNTLEEIALQKAGIMKPGSPCFIDGSNPESVQQVLTDYAKQVEASEISIVHPDDNKFDRDLWHFIPRRSFAAHQQMNIALAYEAAKSTIISLGKPVDPELLATAVVDVVWPGRLQSIDLSAIAPGCQALLDGAHNPQAAEALSQFVSDNIRRDNKPITWLLAMSQGKDLDSIISILIRPMDNVVTTMFGPVDGMPWVEPIKAKDLLSTISRVVDLTHSKYYEDANLALQAAAGLAKQNALVITGSLYLVSDILRLLRAARSK